MTTIDGLIAEGAVGGRTAQVTESGEIECVSYEPRALMSGEVRVQTVRSAISSGTELTFHGRSAPNPYLQRQWNEELRLFEDGEPHLDYPLVLGYRASGVVIESRADGVAPGHRVFGSWRHTAQVTMTKEQALAQTLPDRLSFDDGVDLGQMGPICVNGVAFAEGDHVDSPTVVFGAGPVGLLVAQIARADGARTVAVVDPSPDRLAIARSLGFDVIDEIEPRGAATQLKRRFGANGVTVAFECSGAPSALHEAIRVVRPLGTVVVVGFIQGDAVGLRLGEEFHHNGVRLVSGQIQNVHPTLDREKLIRRSVELALSGEVTFGGLPRLTIPIEDIDRGVAALRERSTLQVALTYS